VVVAVATVAAIAVTKQPVGLTDRFLNEDEAGDGFVLFFLCNEGIPVMSFLSGSEESILGRSRSYWILSLRSERQHGPNQIFALEVVLIPALRAAFFPCLLNSS